MFSEGYNSGGWSNFPEGSYSPKPSEKIIMLPNEVFALQCRAWYEEQGLIVDKTNGEFAHCPYPEDMGEKGYYLLHEHHQQQGLLQSQDVGEMCFFSGDVKKWLLECDPLPDNYFELWDIYDFFMSERGSSLGSTQGPKNVLEKTGIFSPEFDDVRGDWVSKGGETGGKTSGKQAVENKTGVHSEEYINSERYLSDREKGRETQKRLGVGIYAKWVSTIDGYEGSAGLVARHNKLNGWDPSARVKVS